jgi:hypothetical protein
VPRTIGKILSQNLLIAFVESGIPAISSESMF